MTVVAAGPRRLIVTALALVLFSNTAVVSAGTADRLYRTTDQAAYYLTHRLHYWSGIDLRRLTTKTAYCVGSADQSGKSGQSRVNQDGAPVYRSFSCVLNAMIGSGKNGTRVFQLDLVKKRRGWRIKSDES